MSIDFQLGHRCPHLIIEEPVALGSDRRELRPSGPVANINLLRVMANNQFYIPPSGLYSQAILQSDRAGPFRIEGCTTGVRGEDNNTLTVTSSTETKTFRLPIGLRVSTNDLVKIFRTGFDDIIVTNEDGYLAFSDVANIGTKSRIRVEGRAAAALGFGNQQQAIGRLLYPPWTLEKIEYTRPNPALRGDDLITSERFPKFRSPVRSNADFKLTYATRREQCPRCQSTFVENDWRFDPQGDPVFIENEDLLYQAALKILLTERGSNPYHPRYGSRLLNRIGTKIVGATATLLSEDVRSALSRMQDLQTQQARYQKVAIRERLYSILSVVARPFPNDPTAFTVDVVVTNASNQPVRLNIAFTVPGAVALVGSNGQSLGLDTTGLGTDQTGNLR